MRKTWLLLSGALTATAWGANPSFFRTPALHGDQVVFTAEGDLWKVPVDGGQAMRLTSHPGTESNAKISADGKWIAFSGQYEGPTEVYVMPIDGGLPKRLTWSGEGSIPVSWTADGKVLCSTTAYSTLPNEQLVAINPQNAEESLLPLAQASQGVMDETGRLFFTRLGNQSSSTKRYHGGTARNLWRYDPGGSEAVALTADFTGTSENPLWSNDRLYFLTDRSGSMNVWSMADNGSDLKQITKYTDFAVRNADLDGGRLIYQYAGSLHLLTLVDGKDTEIPITLPSDFDQTRLNWVDKPMDYLTRFSVSPNGDRVVLTARGSVFVAPVKPGGRFVEITHPDRGRYREATFMPDGKSLIAQTDETGEIEMVRLPANGIGKPELLTNDGTIFRFAPVVSPDGRWIAWEDKNLELWVRDLTARTSTKVSTSPSRGFSDLSWSPDSKWLAFVEPAENTFPKIRIYRPADGTLVDATSDRVMSSSPTWSGDGKWLYFLSDRELRSLVQSPWGPRQPEPYFTESTRIYALSLKAGERFPFTPPDELHPADSKEKRDHKPDDEKKPDQDEAPSIDIDLDGLATRLFEVPGVSGNLSDLQAVGKFLFYQTRSTGSRGDRRLMRLDISSDSPKAKVFADGYRNYEFSTDHKQIVINKGNGLFVAKTEAEAPAKLDQPVSLNAWSLAVDPKEEWHQIYQESWRMLRDYFYDPKMHGVDWQAIREKYEPLVDRVADRSDLSEILYEMAGELSALHIFVRYGDTRHGEDNIQPSSLGARLSKDVATGGWKVDHIFKTDPDYPGETSPLASPGIEISEGDIITAINGRDLSGVEHPEELLEQKAGQKVLLEVEAGQGAARRNFIVEPLDPRSAADLRYNEWEYTRRQETEQKSDGKIGYVHLRDMGSGSILEWARDFYPVFNRQGLIIDVRNNHGGNTDSWILSRLMRKAWFYWSPRAGQSYSNMQFAFRGHVAVLCNEWTASDGEAFSEGVKRLGLGKVIGTRTWGGQIWLNSQRWLVDNGMCTAAEIGVYGPDGDWLIEGTGVEPDMKVDNLPHDTFQGNDAQLNAAVDYLNQRIAEDPRPMPQAPPKPDKSKPDW
ncbi:S41 family peptidase [Luteolibacter pohnpeiensis]|nr:S41 family peptidase [Luteolibacter pohnpeiensis]